MRIVSPQEEIDRVPDSVVTVGMFDGVHRAHQEILDEMRRRVEERGGRTVVVTFDPHPKLVLGKGGADLQLLTTHEERCELIASHGIDLCRVIPFTYEFSRLSAEEFYRRYVVEGIGVREAVVGYDHMFGKDRSAGIADLKAMGERYGFSVTAMPALSIGGEVVSSTKIRRALLSGDVAKAGEMLGRPYRLGGRVVHGDRRGRALGYPTANLRPKALEKLVPGNGIYFVRVYRPAWTGFGMMSIGTRPTFTTDHERVVEVHIFDIDEDLYGGTVSVEFLERIRDERRFDTAEELVAEMRRDEEKCRTLLKHTGEAAGGG
ncbi:MAG: bifunctional riboflavin kinase/FMN adenylyltransferase [Ignavibacteriales bacterium CG07_land_8_20_14_0_80_59_12]|nr:MAG: bifunctional riboflavin kinase/FMN adenylyltransferase [Ignavibacteriales bacterium CG07_land_8_20_14_0_80_59_12]